MTVNFFTLTRIYLLSQWDF